MFFKSIYTRYINQYMSRLFNLRIFIFKTWDVLEVILTPSRMTNPSNL